MSDHGGHPEDYEHKDVNLPVVTAVSALTLGFIVLSIAWVDWFFFEVKQYVVEKNVYNRQNPSLYQQRTEATERLSSAGKNENGSYHIPIDDAIKSMAAEVKEEEKK